jgi:HNH endonuclease
MTRPWAEIAAIQQSVPALTGPVKIVITDGKIRMQMCGLYAHTSAILQAHHVIPESWWLKAGKPVESPMRDLCPTCHMNVHAAIDGILRELDVSYLPRRAQALGRAGINLGKMAGLTPALTL